MHMIYLTTWYFDTDVLTKDYISDQKLSISTYSDTGVVWFYPLLPLIDLFLSLKSRFWF